MNHEFPLEKPARAIVQTTHRASYPATKRRKKTDLQDIHASHPKPVERLAIFSPTVF